MKFMLTRNLCIESGIFGTLVADDGSFTCITLEHAYDSGNGDGSYTAKVAPDTYICRRHPPTRLPYETFELQNVPDFQGKPVVGILIHKGNYDKDSEGCILIGTSVVDLNNGKMITSSAPIFNQFMSLLNGIDEFTLTIM
jgi:hypothetical protein